MNPATVKAAVGAGLGGLALIMAFYMLKMQNDQIATMRAEGREDRVYNTQKILEGLADMENACKKPTDRR